MEYVDDQGAVVFLDRFYDPGLDEQSWMALEMKGFQKHRAYGCGRPFNP